jgi:signal transduction histidine kinase
MGSDSRIQECLDAARAMRNGRFDVAVPTDGDDEVAALGAELVELGRFLDKKCKEMNRLLEVTERINSGMVTDEILDHVYESFRELIPYDRIGMALLEDDGKTVVARWARSEAAEIMIPQGYSAPLAGSSLETILRTGRPRILNDLPAYLKENPQSESSRLIVEEGMRSSLTCPLIAMGKPTGLLFFSSMERNTYKDVHVELFLEIAGHVSTAIEKGRQCQELLELNQVKNRLLGVVAHDLRNPIGVLKTYLTLFLEDMLGEVPEKHKGVMQTMMRNCKRMQALVDDLLDISAIESGRLELDRREVDLHGFLQECFEDSQILAGAKSIEITLDVDPVLPRTRIDPNRISQVIGNLVGNAIKFSRENTRITLGAQSKDGAVEFFVADQGQGIPEEDIPRLFQDYTKASSRPTAGEKSTGLGLAIAKRVVEAHNGRIWVESKVGEGSTFSFRLSTAKAD